MLEAYDTEDTEDNDTEANGTNSFFPFQDIHTAWVDPDPMHPHHFVIVNFAFHPDPGTSRG